MRSYIGEFRRKENQKPVKINLHLDIENFGPITKGKIELKPLTVFVGPNNSGKSYATMLIHSILSTENQFEYMHLGDVMFASTSSILQDCDKQIKNIAEKNRKKSSFIIPKSLTKKMLASLIEEIFSSRLKSGIEGNFGSPVNSLIQKKSKSSKITVSNSHKFTITLGKDLSIKSQELSAPKYKIQITPKSNEYYAKYEHKEDTVTFTVDGEYGADFLKYEITTEIFRSLARQIKHADLPDDSYYFPATRSGILQGHKALSASIIKSAHYGGVESFQIPKLSKVVSDFISNIIVIPNKAGPFYKFSEELESELLHGHIHMPTLHKSTFPEIMYDAKGMEIPLHRTSSTISEIAPFSLYLKHIIYPSSLLIIEEPEAHLHPANQVTFAKYIVKMIRKGLNVLLTTHSVFLLEQIGKYMLASKLEPDIRVKELGYDKDDYLLYDEVSSYVFVRNNDGGHSIKPIEINNEEGISQEEFVKVNESLYSESLKIHKNLPEQ